MSLFKSLKPMTPEQSKMMMGLGIGLLTNKGRFNDGLGQGLALGNQMVNNLKVENRAEQEAALKEIQGQQTLQQINFQRRLMGLPPLDMPTKSSQLVGQAGQQTSSSVDSTSTEESQDMDRMMAIIRGDVAPANQLEAYRAQMLAETMDIKTQMPAYLRAQSEARATTQNEVLIDRETGRRYILQTDTAGNVKVVDAATGEQITDTGIIDNLSRDRYADQSTAEISRASGQRIAQLHEDANNAIEVLYGLDDIEKTFDEIENAFTDPTGFIQSNEFLQLASRLLQNLRPDKAPLDIPNIDVLQFNLKALIPTLKNLTPEQQQEMEQLIPQIKQDPIAFKKIIGFLREENTRHIDRRKAWVESEQAPSKFLEWEADYTMKQYEKSREQAEKTTKSRTSSDDAFNLNQIEEAIESGPKTPIEPKQLRELNELAYNENLKKGAIIQDNQTNKQFRYLGDDKWEEVQSPKTLNVPAQPTMPKLPLNQQQMAPQIPSGIGGPHPLNRNFGR